MTNMPEKIKQNVIFSRVQLSLVSQRIMVEQTRELMRYESDLTHPLYNSVIAYHQPLSDKDTKEDIERLINGYQARKVPFTWLTWSHDADHANLAQALAENGLKKVDSLSGMSVSLPDWTYISPAIHGLNIKPIRTRAEMNWFREIVLPVFGFEGEAGEALVQISEDAAFGENAAFRHYIGFMDGQPVAAATAIHDGDTIGIYNVATLEGYRRRGLGSALTAHAAREGQAAGGRVAVLLASKMGQGVYQAIGFEENVTIDVYLG
ncbi:GNAT family N-acetyltransferase [Paenibacillus sp. BC26]|uniref:GNAT family N-acetyltransferase n=1 Tax=Paenibacillus sp. BC26 TaxID=1881032 RepID=UPI0008E0D9CD|nr:GNAT family N-acetyltransferase [Paenibacillus sp. BC26]SFS62355.1 Acetyltransferase (GNAT) domain-containing protein [Paenibacillus sp. BC26]